MEINNNNKMPLPELEQQLDTIARSVHDSWMRQRQKEGWTFAEEYSREKKTTPVMVDYAMLPDSEKEVDRATVRQVIASLTELGYQIRR